MKKIGIFSGSFDPIHMGHMAFVETAIKRCRLDKVYFLPEPRPRRKQGVKALEHRINMIQLAIKNQPQLGTIILQQARFSVPETLPKLQARFKGAKLYMLIGEDVLGHMINWPHLETLVKSVGFIIGTRRQTVSELDRHIAVIEKTRGLDFNYTIFTASDNGLSSLSARRQLRLGQRPRSINPEVLDYIDQHKLYAPLLSAE